jgi:hypothetical protein
MSKKLTTFRQVREQFANEDQCLEHVMRAKFGQRFRCQWCSKDARYYRIRGRKAYECEHCANQIYPCVGTPFEKSRTPLTTWFHVMYMFCTTRNGVSAKEIQRVTGVTYKTAWRMGHEIRKYMAYVDGDAPIGGPGGGIVEADETQIGGRDKKGAEDKAHVMGVLERGGDMMMRVIPNRREATMVRLVVENVLDGSRVATDEAHQYRDLSKIGYIHGAVNHERKEWARGPIHTNTLEACWAWVQRGIHGTHVWVSQKHLPKYLGEFEYRFNLRSQPSLMFSLLVSAFARPALVASR